MRPPHSNPKIRSSVGRRVPTPPRWNYKMGAKVGPTILGRPIVTSHLSTSPSADGDHRPYRAFKPQSHIGHPFLQLDLNLPNKAGSSIPPYLILNSTFHLSPSTSASRQAVNPLSGTLGLEHRQPPTQLQRRQTQPHNRARPHQRAQPRIRSPSFHEKKRRPTEG